MGHELASELPIFVLVTNLLLVWRTVLKPPVIAYAERGPLALRATGGRMTLGIEAAGTVYKRCPVTDCLALTNS